MDFQPLLKSAYGDKLTLPECLERICQIYPERKALGTRELLCAGFMLIIFQLNKTLQPSVKSDKNPLKKSEIDEPQPNGKVFKKVN